jgi:hemin uptake protein HemP
MVLAAMPNQKPDTDSTIPQASKPADPPRVVVKSSEILRGNTEIWIEHGTEMYRLRLTRAGKLLLSK